MICPLCGRESDTKDLVCPHCGTNMAEVDDRNLKFPNSPIILYGFLSFGLGLYSLIVSNKDAFFYFTVGFLLMTFAFLLVILKKKVRNS